MKNISKLILPVLILTVLGLIYYNYFKPSDELGDFSRFNTGSEINQEINVAIVKSKNIGRDKDGKIISFIAKDKNNVEVKINFHDPIPDDIINAQVIELLGHLHKDGFSAARASIIK